MNLVNQGWRRTKESGPTQIQADKSELRATAPENIAISFHAARVDEF
jgi:hypothetical protein